MSSRPELKLDYCSHDAAKFAVERWHYSRCTPAGKMVKVGVWEQGKFIGVVLFSCGASPPMYVWAKQRLNLESTEVCELTRVALAKHISSVSRIIAIAMRLLKAACPKLRCVVSFADRDEDHHGGIYQAGNWTFVGTSNIGGRQGWIVKGKKMHARSVVALSGSNSIEGARRLDPFAREFITKGKHKYLFSLDSELRARIAPLAKPYPKRAGSADSGTSVVQTEGGGANPTSALTDNGDA
jgi:hypothetical protein